jgi:hypothetical protein
MIILCLCLSIFPVILANLLCLPAQEIAIIESPGVYMSPYKVVFMCPYQNESAVLKFVEPLSGRNSIKAKTAWQEMCDQLVEPTQTDKC